MSISNNFPTINLYLLLNSIAAEVTTTDWGGGYAQTRQRVAALEAK